MTKISQLILWGGRLIRRISRRESPPVASKNESPQALFPEGQALGNETPRDVDSNRSLLEDCVALMVELDAMAPQLDPSARALSEHVSARLFEIMERNGVERIEGTGGFDIARHQAWPPSKVRQGTVILGTVEPGLAMGPRILKRARVKV